MVPWGKTAVGVTVVAAAGEGATAGVEDGAVDTDEGSEDNGADGAGAEEVVVGGTTGVAADAEGADGVGGGFGYILNS